MDSMALGVKNSRGSMSSVLAFPVPVVWGSMDGRSAIIVGDMVAVADLGASWSTVLSPASASMTWWCNEIGCETYSSTASPGQGSPFSETRGYRFPLLLLTVVLRPPLPRCRSPSLIICRRSHNHRTRLDLPYQRYNPKWDHRGNSPPGNGRYDN